MGGSPRSQGPAASSTSHLLSSSTGWRISCRRRGSTGTGITGCLHRITSSGPPSRRMTKGNVGKRQEAATGGHTDDGSATGGCCDATHATQKLRSHDTSRIAWAKGPKRGRSSFRNGKGNGKELRPLLNSLRRPREKRQQSGCGAFRETRSGRPGRSSRGSQVAHQPEDRCQSAIGRAIPNPIALQVYWLCGLSRPIVLQDS